MMCRPPTSSNDLNLSIDDAETSIQSIKDIYEQELTDEKIGSRFLNICKKLYIPLINLSLQNTYFFSKEDTEHPIRQLLNQIINIGRYHKDHAESPSGIALAAATELIINSLIKAAIDGEDTLELTTAELKPLAAECQHQLSNKTTQQSPSPTKHQQTALEQAQHFVSSTLADCDQTQAIAAKMKADWLRVLELNINIYGSNSSQWVVAANIFIQLCDYNDPSQLPPQLRAAASHQLTFAGIHAAGFGIQKSADAPPTGTHANFKEGQWFDYTSPKGDVIRCKIAAIIKQAGRYILVSRQGGKLLDLQEGQFQQMIRNGSLAAKDSALAANSLESVLSNIKHKPTTEPSLF